MKQWNKFCIFCIAPYVNRWDDPFLHSLLEPHLTTCSACSEVKNFAYRMLARDYFGMSRCGIFAFKAFPGLVVEMLAFLSFLWAQTLNSKPYAGFRSFVGIHTKPSDRQGVKLSMMSGDHFPPSPEPYTRKPWVL